VLASTTALIVAHRPSTVMLADRVALLEEGRITAVGTHSELLHESEHYAFVISSLEDEQRRQQAAIADRVGPRDPRPVSRSGSEGLDTRPTASGAARPPDIEPVEPIAREEATR